MHNNELKLTRSAMARRARPSQLNAVFCGRWGVRNGGSRDGYGDA